MMMMVMVMNFEGNRQLNDNETPFTTTQGSLPPNSKTTLISFSGLRASGHILRNWENPLLT
jgi:hypothetical protein